MDWNQVVGEWKQLVERVRQKWGRLTDDDMEQIDGRREKLISRASWSHFSILRGHYHRSTDYPTPSCRPVN